MSVLFTSIRLKEKERFSQITSLGAEALLITITRSSVLDL
jgi:hypothetical protein